MPNSHSNDAFNKREEGLESTKSDQELPSPKKHLIDSTSLLKMCNWIGKSIKKQFVSPIFKKAKSLSDQIYEIAVTSNVNFRQVLLEKKWWKSDHGPLLGTEKDQTQPIALIPDQTGDYQVFSSKEQQPSIVDKKVGKKISPIAWMFYRAFPLKNVLSLKEIFSYCSFGRKWDYLMILFSSLLVAVLGLFTPFATKILFDQVIPFLDNLMFFQVMLILFVILLGIISFSLTKEYTILRIQSHLSHDFDTAIWQRLLILPATFFKKYMSGNLIQRLSGVREVRRAFSTQMIRIIINILFSLFFLLAMIYFSPALTFGAVSILILGIIPIAAMLYLNKKYAIAFQESQGTILGNIVEIIFGLSKIRTNGAENRLFSRCFQEIIEAQTLRYKIGNTGVYVTVLSSMIDILKYLVVFVIAIYLMNVRGKDSQISIGDYIGFITALSSFSAAILDFTNVALDLLLVQPFWNRIKIFLDQPPEDAVNSIKTGHLKGDILIEHLSFRYSAKAPFIYKDVSLHIRAGEYVALVGPSGCGKSTLLRLILGFETPERGAIYFDGMNLETLNVSSVRRQAGVVLQDSRIIDGTILDNIIVGHVSDEEEIKRAIQLAGLELLIQQLPMGINTLVAAGGATLSGGERQRILLARSFLQNPILMIWDEATSFLDNATQELIIKNLEQSNATRIVVAHRLNTIKNADRIIVIDKGNIVNSGTFDELANSKGLFADLLAEQKEIF